MSICNRIRRLRAFVEQLEQRALLSISTPTNLSQSQVVDAEPTIAVDPNNSQNRFVAGQTPRSDGSANAPVAKYTTNGGTTWAASTFSGGLTGAVDVNAAYDGEGNVWLLTFHASVSSPLVLYLSQDHGATFTLEHNFSTANGDYYMDDYPRLAVGYNFDDIWVVYQSDTANNGTGFSRIVAEGTTFTTGHATDAFNSGIIRKYVLADGSSSVEYDLPDIARGISGMVCAAWQDNTGKIYASTNAGLDYVGPPQPPPWSTPVLAATGTISVPPAAPRRGVQAGPSVGMSSQPAPILIATQPYIVYNFKPSGSTGTNVYVTLLGSDGTWSSGVAINSDAAAGNAWHFEPRTMADPATGAMAVAWYDTRDDATSGNDDTDVYATVSTDQGLTWQPNVRVTTQKSNALASDNSAPSGSSTTFDYGEYMGVALVNNVFCPTWSDNSASLSNIQKPPGASAYPMEVATNQLTDSVFGTVFSDVNANGVKDAGEPGIAGATVFVDANGNGTLDTGERSTTTDSSGNYSFPNAKLGPIIVQGVRPTGYHSETAPLHATLNLGTDIQYMIGFTPISGSPALTAATPVSSPFAASSPIAPSDVGESVLETRAAKLKQRPELFD
jgi:hypothetical protein